MITDFTLIVENKPGRLADVAEAIGRVGENIEGVCCFVSQSIAQVHVAVEQAGAIRGELERLGLKIYEEREVAIVPLEDQPGAAARVLRRLADAGVNVEMAYLATGTRLVVAGSDLNKVNHVLH
jgi:hypothetical protein